MKLWHYSHLQGLSSQVVKWFLITFISLASLLFIYPSAFIYPKDTLPDNNDTRLIAYIIGQVQSNILEHKPLHYGTFFFPDQNTLAYSDLFLTSALMMLPARLFTEHPIVIFNLALTFNFVLTIISSYLLFGYLFKDHWITTLGVILFNFSGFHLSYFPHLQIFSLWPLCLSIYFFVRYLNENRTIFLLLFFLIVTVQIAESIFPSYLIFFACLIIILFGKTNVAGALANNRTQAGTRLREIRVRFWRGPKRNRFASIFIHSLPFIPIWIFLLLPYYQLHTSLPEATRPLRDAAHFSLGLDQIFTFYHSWTVITIFFICATARVLLGNYPLKQKRGIFLLKKNFCDEAKAAAKRWLSGLRFPQKNTDERPEKIWWIVFFFSITMSLGPVLKIFGQTVKIFDLPIPLPYTLFYYLFPGFTGFRTPSRFIILALLSAVVIIGFQLKPIFEKLKLKTKIIFIFLVTSFLFLEADLPLKSYPININMHPVYGQVKNLPADAVILELPIKLWNMPDHEIESVRSLYSLFHNHRRFGGFSGFATNRWIRLVQNINAYGPTPPIVQELQSLGVTHIIQNNILSPLPF
ncbi:TPA: hypothetical protein DIU27_01150 [Candidatus Collierbacteria bacterium]|uniref:Glycosyltransferase RgtA/B/C/D-like domain-containing protein n=1 Tax=Candidatus Collierbacteria bacterium GW2011_GWB2_44_22 TaxID=1618387 RepID=A0A0G1KUU5_9BACT|nr:MAG: hypothetical protein UW31_C0010G0055 [Candidatus Collierbacteria bacterium GW2011_GWA2_44_13]KKT50816.1 MAG: hypothetical protein UW42_C0014G0011 [Candidatus Collierbacteria bacterium GW2011_GWB1_44_197]KKT51659.1 MAG: hypothetical protein UW44_C0009G0023 [Candidatus Collierbacteria bacterium GW2011_GWB2_44_22]KKT62587.1 MAG: hypothetical protein UW56_C0005G0023 [Candidatus Collierbacteria bacterium GW2011_GWD1_44_27]KKT66037.1 MAG: hypothetical protein UW58_C0014G0024 [Candidatus Colli